SSYVEIPEREWKAGDRVEIEMPFGTHIFYGPDRMEVAATAEGGPSTQFEPMWEGALMYGPLVMASPDITTWEEAEISLDAEEIEAGFDGNVHKLTFEGKTFYPDYYMTGRGTHYLRLNAKQSD
ncbi:MAG: hypothetical protein IKI89_05175, partial [Bacteroidales bacterium]|nr:hypothetical protein [Bacteroidales bacterium]